MKSESRSRKEIANDLYFIASEDHLRAEKSLILEAARALLTQSETEDTNERSAAGSGAVPVKDDSKPDEGRTTPAASAPLPRAVRRLCEHIRRADAYERHDFTVDPEFIAVEALVGAPEVLSAVAPSAVGDIERAAKVCDQHAALRCYNMDEKRVAMSCAERIRSLPSATGTPFPEDLLADLVMWTKQVGEQPPERVARGISSAARGLHHRLGEYIGGITDRGNT